MNHPNSPKKHGANTASVKKLPKHIAMQVDKNNFVVAIKSLSQEKNISLEEAKDWIDAYTEQKEKSNKDKLENGQTIGLLDTLKTQIATRIKNEQLIQNDKKTGGFAGLHKNLDDAIEAQGVSPKTYPWWVRPLVILLIIFGLSALLLWLVF